MRIGLNLLHALPEIGGGWNYISNLVTALGEYDEINTYVAFVTRASKCLVPAQLNFRSILINIRAVSRFQRVVYENTWLQLLAKKYQVDCMHWFANTQAVLNTVPAVVTVYDMQPFLNRATFSSAKRLYLRVMMTHTARRARMLLPMSEATARDLTSLLNASRARMTIIPPIVNSQFRPANDEACANFRLKYHLPDKFWLYIAHLYPHKNHARLLQAYHHLKLQGIAHWPLVLRGDPKGSETEVMEAIVHLQLSHDVIFLPRLDEAELPILYSAASALVFPSLYEGGGIPVVEAMACGCPVLASSIPAVHEFAGNAAAYFDPADYVSIAQAMAESQINTRYRELKRRDGLARAVKFRAQPIVTGLLDAYARAAQK